MPPAPLVCLDLDGTLVDSRGPFAACLRGALADRGLPDRAPETLHRFLGPPFEETARTLLGDSGRDAGTDQVEALMAAYRARYRSEGVDATEAVVGVPEALEALRAEGFRLVVVTSKIRPFAEAVVAATGLDALLDGVFGPEADEREVPKERTLRTVLGAREHGGAVMVGDRHHDVDAANAVGIPAVGVTWAGGHEAELAGAGAAAVVDGPGALACVVAATLRAA